MSSEQAPDYGLVITLPTKLDERELDRLLELVNAKSDLISKSLGTSQLSIRSTEEGVSFPWSWSHTLNGSAARSLAVRAR